MWYRTGRRCDDLRHLRARMVRHRGHDVGGDANERAIAAWRSESLLAGLEHHAERS
jgi:hypothetical protein